MFQRSRMGLFKRFNAKLCPFFEDGKDKPFGVIWVCQIGFLYGLAHHIRAKLVIIILKELAAFAAPMRNQADVLLIGLDKPNPVRVKAVDGENILRLVLRLLLFRRGLSLLPAGIASFLRFFRPLSGFLSHLIKTAIE